MEYTITNDISKATAWFSLPDTDSCIKDYIIPNKAYKLIKMKDGFEEEDYFILSEDNHYSMYYMTHNGFFIIQKEGNKTINENS